MKKIISCLNSINPMSIQILKHILAVLAAMLLSYTAIKASINEYGVSITKLRCVEIYPLLIFMTASLSFVAALLIDVYDKTEIQKK